MVHCRRMRAAALVAGVTLGCASAGEHGAARDGDEGDGRVGSATGALECAETGLFAQALPSPPEAVPSRMHAMAVGAGGEILLAGELVSQVDFGGRPLVPTGGSDAFVVKLDRCGGVVWSKAFGDSEDQTALDAAMDPAGNVTVMGLFEGTIDLGAGSLTGDDGELDAFVARLDPGGQAAWVKHVTGGWPSSIAVDAAGNTFLLGSFEGVVSFGDSQVQSSTAAGFLAKIDPAGHTVWSARLPTAADEAPYQVDLAPSGRIFVAGYDVRGHGLFVLSLAPDGAVLWNKRFFAMEQTNEWFADLAVSHDGHARIAGAGYLGSMGQPGGRASPFIAELDDAGEIRWIERGDVPWTGITATAGGATLAAGTACTPEGPPCDLVLTELDSLGNEVRSRRFGGAGAAFGLEADADRIVMAGAFRGELQLPPEPIQTTGSALFVAGVPRQR